MKICERYSERCFNANDSKGQDTADKILDEVVGIPSADVTEVETLKKLIQGEWVDTELVCKALSIDFSTGMKMFDFSRTAEWNKPPLNGQKVTTKFRLKNQNERRDVGFWVEEEGWNR